MDLAARNLSRWGYALHDILQMTSELAAQYIGLESGLEVGMPADLVVLREDFTLEEVYIGGQRVRVPA